SSRVVQSTISYRAAKILRACGVWLSTICFSKPSSAFSIFQYCRLLLAYARKYNAKVVREARNAQSDTFQIVTPYKWGIVFPSLLSELRFTTMSVAGRL